MNVGNVMTDIAYVASTDTNIGEVAKKMKDLNVGSVPVCNEQNQLMGVITVRDIVLNGIAGGTDNMANVNDIMSKGVVSVTSDTDVHEAARIMGENKVRRLPVLENNVIVGTVSMGDLAVKNDF